MFLFRDKLSFSLQENILTGVTEVLGDLGCLLDGCQSSSGGFYNQGVQAEASHGAAGGGEKLCWWAESGKKGKQPLTERHTSAKHRVYERAARLLFVLFKRIFNFTLLLTWSINSHPNLTTESSWQIKALDNKSCLVVKLWLTGDECLRIILALWMFGSQKFK